MKRKRNRSESNYVRRKINRWVRFLAKERDWDYTFMLEMEYMKLRQMEEYFKGRDTFPLKKKPTSLAVAFREEFSQV